MACFLSSPIVQTCKLPPFKPDELYVPGGSWSFCPFPRRGVLHIEGLKGCLNKMQQWHQVVRTIQDISCILALWNISLFTCYCYTVLFHQLPSAAPNTAIIGSHYLANHVKVGIVWSAAPLTSLHPHIGISQLRKDNFKYSLELDGFFALWQSGFVAVVSKQYQG